LFVVAPVNFIFAIGPLLVGFLLFMTGWIASAAVVLIPLGLLVHFAWISFVGIGAADVLLLLAVFALGQLAALSMVSISRLMARAVWAWLNWNISFLRAEPSR
jgi:hypothetical protein